MVFLYSLKKIHVTLSKIDTELNKRSTVVSNVNVVDWWNTQAMVKIRIDEICVGTRLRVELVISICREMWSLGWPLWHVLTCSLLISWWFQYESHWLRGMIQQWQNVTCFSWPLPSTMHPPSNFKPRCQLNSGNHYHGKKAPAGSGGWHLAA